MREVVPFALGRIADVGLFGVGGLLSFLFYFFFSRKCCHLLSSESRYFVAVHGSSLAGSTLPKTGCFLL